MNVAERIASTIEAIANCRQSGNTEWEAKHDEALAKIVRNHLPSGSGFDSGTLLDTDRSRPDRLVFTTGFHHMTEGSYDGWLIRRMDRARDYGPTVFRGRIRYQGFGPGSERYQGIHSRRVPGSSLGRHH